MRFLLTSDWQAAPGNLEECEQAHQELLAAVDKYKPTAVINLGDFKEHYNPIFGEVTKFWIRATREVAAKIPMYALMGNHDRFSQSIESDNWMDVLAAAGARIITTPKYLQDWNMAFLPYAHREQTIEWAAKLARKVNGQGGLLFFHCDVTGAWMGHKETSGITPDELQASAYEACFGGHIHAHQSFGDNLWYVGSPFCQDWGEANQTKGFVLIETTHTEEGTGQWAVRQIRTTIPRWYDFEYLDKEQKVPEPGSFVRIHVPITTKKVMDELRSAETELLQRYGDINVFAVPDIQKSDSDTEIIAEGSSDEEMLAQYVAATIPDAARFTPEDVIAYLQKTLPETSVVVARGTRFVSCIAKNVLSFETLKIPYAKQGLVVLKGVNRSWPKRSNGAGKSNLLAMLTVAVAGETVKDQSRDDWAAEFTEDPAEVILRVQGANGKECEVERGRRPHKLLLKVDGVDRSTGIVGSRQGETQGRIEAFLGMSMHTLLNSVYIDQSVANGFLFGTQKDRMDLVAKLQNLGRFEAALKIATEDAKTASQTRDTLQREIDRLKERYTILLDGFKATRHEAKSTILTSADNLERQIASLAEEYAELKAHAEFYKDLQTEIDSLENESADNRKELTNVRGILTAINTRLVTVQKLVDAGKCSMCGSKITAANTEERDTLLERKSTAQESIRRWTKAIETSDAKADQAQDKLRKYRERCVDVERDLKNRREQLADLEHTISAERYRLTAVKEQRRQAKRELLKTREQIRTTRQQYGRLSVRVEMLEYAKKAFHRNGIPLALSIALCPKLNAAAEEFSQIFNSGKIRIRFAVVNGDFDVEVINTAGSGQTNGQSVGEAAMAGVICAFSLREAAPKTNLLILDEPGHGLDAEGQREFAQGLLQLKDKYETIIVTTHSQIIESVLGGETIWVVEKTNRISRLIREK